jgi:hypothetical protein
MGHRLSYPLPTDKGWPSPMLDINSQTQVPPSTLIKTAKIFWRDFAPAWAFPVIFLYGGRASDELGHPLLFFYFVVAPFFFWSLNRAWRPFFQQKVRYWHSLFWGMLLPCVIWAVAVAFNVVI